jgi:hypothetical protein
MIGRIIEMNASRVSEKFDESRLIRRVKIFIDDEGEKRE